MLILLLLSGSLASYAATDLQNRSIVIGTSNPSATTIHTLTFDIPDTPTLGSIKVEYCSNDPFPDTACTIPSGLDLSSVTLSQSGVTGFTIHASSTSNKLILSRIPAPAISATSVYAFANVVNPNVPNATTYVRISTYSSADASGSYIDKGGVVFSTSGNLSVGGFVPPYLQFCSGVIVSIDCSTTSGDFQNFGELSVSQTKIATSQFAAATNDPTGYVTYIFGTTLTSGSNLITALTNPTPPQTGVSQFGINVRANTNPLGGQDREGIGTATPHTRYNTPNMYAFQSGDQLVASVIPTEPNRFTITYVVNVPSGQAPGVYSTTMSLLAVAQF